VLFCYIQITYLFGAKGILPEGFTYAEYAREGFFQLLFVCILNLIMVLVGINLFRENKCLKGILCVISLCTFVMIASSAYRMILYIRFYYLTFLRIFVLWALMVIALWMIGIIIQIFKKDFPLFQYGLTVLSVCYILFSFSKPDYIIAKVNTEHIVLDENGHVADVLLWDADAYEGSYLPPMKEQFFLGYSYEDTWYLNNLCADAAPVIMTEEAMKRYYYCIDLEKKIEEKYAPIGWSKDAANRALADMRRWNQVYIEKQLVKAEECWGRTYNISQAYPRHFLKTIELQEEYNE